MDLKDLARKFRVVADTIDDLLAADAPLFGPDAVVVAERIRQKAAARRGPHGPYRKRRTRMTAAEREARGLGLSGPLPGSGQKSQRRPPRVLSPEQRNRLLTAVEEGHGRKPKGFKETYTEMMARRAAGILFRGDKKE